MGGVDWRVFPHHHAGRHLNARPQDVQQIPSAAGKDFPVDQRFLNVLVPRQRPEVVPLVVVDRRLFAKALVGRIGVGVDIDVVRVEVDVGITDNHRPPSLKLEQSF